MHLVYSTKKLAVLFGAAFLCLAVALPVFAQNGQWKHAISLMSTPKYSENFPHFDYVNPNAPKGGKLRLNDYGAFDTLNPLLAKGNLAEGLGLIFERLMISSLDEVSTEYGHIAQSIYVSPDLSYTSFKLRPEAKWHDGVPITAHDVVFSFEAAKKHNPQISIMYQGVTKAEALDDKTVKFHFSQKDNKELPLIVGQLTVLPKHWWEGKNAQGEARSIAQTTLEPLLGSGPYKIKSVKAGQSISYERVENYWGKNLPSQIGANNFDEIEYIAYRDETVALEGFKAGAYDVRLENVARLWATAYNFPARKNGQVVIQTFPDQTRGIMQAFVPNLRKAKYADARVRQALNLVFDFEDINRALFFGQYQRIGSFFAGSELASDGLASPQELVFLEPLREEIPKEVFEKPYENPINGSAQNLRNNMHKATQLLAQAGWVIKTEEIDQKEERSLWLKLFGIAPPKAVKRMLVNQNNEPFEIEFLLHSPTFEKIILAYRPSLEKLGISVKIRTVDASQYVNRLRSRDFDMIVFSWAQSLSPGNEQREYWGSASAKREGSRNMAGIENAAIDKLIENVVAAQTREQQVAATKALDRVLLANHYVIPQWSSPVVRMARWDKFSYPQALPKYSIGFPTLWWFDIQKSQMAQGQK